MPVPGRAEGISVEKAIPEGAVEGFAGVGVDRGPLEQLGPVAATGESFAVFGRITVN